MDRTPREYAIGDLLLESGRVIEDCRVSACVHGRPSRECNNVVLVAASLGGDHRRLEFLIGPGRALDTQRYCVVATSALGNGLSSSPSNSRTQPGDSFPHFSLRDMVASQRKLLEHLGVARLFCVIGASMGGMQALQWAVSHPRHMDCIVALTPMARTSAWSKAVTLISRQLLLADPGWRDGHASAETWRAWAALLQIIAGRTPAAIAHDCPDDEAEALLDREVQAIIAEPPDPRDWIWQIRAYDDHDLGPTPGCDGDTHTALQKILVPTLIMAAPGDLMNPESGAKWACGHIADCVYREIPSRQGHQAASSLHAAEVSFMNAEIARFLQEHDTGLTRTR